MVHWLWRYKLNEVCDTIDELAEPAITSYLAHLARKGRIEKICFLLAHCATESYPIPKSLRNVTRLSANIQKKWPESYLEELKLLKNRNVYEVVDLSKKRKVIKNCWVFNIKFDGHYRSWLVAKGFSQIERIDFDKLFSLVVYYEIACLLLAITTLENWNIYSVDIKTAYLYGDLDEEIYIKQP